MSNQELKIKTPKGWRKGQTIFNFLEWLRREGYQAEEGSRMADPFHIEDADLEKLFNIFLEEQQ